METFKRYASLTKPGIIRGNAITATGAFALASMNHFSIPLFLAMVLGLSLVIASACVVNNYIDRDIDALMERTRERVLVRKLVSSRAVFIFASTLLVLGAFILLLYTNLLALAFALMAWIAYVGPYSLWAKRHTVHSTIIGAVSGAMPPVVGYVAVTNHLDFAAALLFIILIAWQMPHFFAIALRRQDEFEAAHLPVMPIVQGVQATKISMLLYVGIFTLSTLTLWEKGYVGYWYLGIISLIDLTWLALATQGFWASDTKKWAKQMFLLSLVVILVFSVMIGVD
jgi:protoheme IX farnesyltransferase